MVSLYQLSFYAAIFFTILGGALGLVGVWFEGFWRNDMAWRLLVTDFILAGTAIIVAVITKFLAN